LLPSFTFDCLASLSLLARQVHMYEFLGTLATRLLKKAHKVEDDHSVSLQYNAPSCTASVVSRYSHAFEAPSFTNHHHERSPRERYLRQRYYNGQPHLKIFMPNVRIMRTSRPFCETLLTSPASLSPASQTRNNYSFPLTGMIHMTKSCLLFKANLKSCWALRGGHIHPKMER
jgi:hypothetical protein